MTQKKRILILGITMDPAGTEQSFLSFSGRIDYSRYDVTLLLARKSGLFLSRLPAEIRVEEMAEGGELFTLNRKTAPSAIFRSVLLRHPGKWFSALWYAVRMAFSPRRRPFLAMRLWRSLEKVLPDRSGSFDAALAFWGDKTMFYMLDHVQADRKIAWLHFDYEHPPREDALYGPAFAACDRVVTVSEAIADSLRSRFPEIRERICVLENRIDPRQIWDLAMSGESFPDPSFRGKRILTIGRIAPQKGLDLAAEALALLRRKGLEPRWYVIGDGTEEDLTKLRARALDLGVADLLILLGPSANPYPCLRDCDLYVQPSRHEGKPIAVEEAKILYKTILVTDYLSAAEQTGNGTLGMIVECSAEALADGIRSLLSDPSLSARYADRVAETMHPLRFLPPPPLPEDLLP